MATATRSRTEQSTLVLDADWSRGMIRDAPLGSLPEGSVFNARDYLLHRPGLAQKRGGTSYSGPALTGASYGAAVAYAEFPAGAQLVAVGNNGHFYTVTSGTTTDVNSMGSAYVPVDKPKFRVGATKNLLVITANDGTSAPKAYNGSSVAALGGTPPAGTYAAVYKTRLVLAGTSANPDRLFFSPVADIEASWDTTTSYVDTDYPVKGLAALQNALLIWSERKLQRITGTTPPPGTDFDRAPIDDIGCSDARSISIYRGRAIFANPLGVFSTDGVGVKNHTEEAGLDSYWRGLFSKTETYSIATGLDGSFLTVVILDSSRAYVDGFLCHLPRNAWKRVSNFKALMFAHSVGLGSELYYADASTNRIVSTSGIFTPAAGNKNDADGTAVLPTLTTRLLGGGPTLKHFGFAHLSMDMRDAASDNPTMTVTAAPGLEGSTYTAVTESPLAEGADNTRYRFTVGKVSQGVSMTLTQTAASAKTELYALELEARPLQVQAGGQ